ncbi:hypothetical protein GP486_008894, partial [Trichoglossum hirsutum]
LRYRPDGRHLVLMNTHLDDSGAESRLRAAGLIRAVVRRHVRARHRVVLAGDFNCEVSDPAYRCLTGADDDDDDDDDDDNDGDGRARLLDLRELVAERDRHGHEFTFTGFGNGDGPSARIDFIFLAGFAGGKGEGEGEKEEEEKEEEDDVEEEEEGRERNGRSRAARGYAVMSNRFDDGIYLSDHRAVVGDILLS